MGEKFSLKWNDYLVNVIKKFSSLRNEDDFSDVTLVSSDKKQVSAHKVVLSSCSDYFKTILKSNNKSNNIILCLENINHEELNNVLDYVYNGQVNIEQEQLDRFLTIAQRFQLEGLMSDKSGEPIVEEETISFLAHHSNQSLSKTEDGEDIKKVTKNGVQDNIIISSDEFQSVEELDEKLIENLVRVGGTKKFQCTVCNKVSRDLFNAREHVEIHFEGLSFPCQACDETFRTRNALRNHMKRKCNERQISGPGRY